MLIIVRFHYLNGYFYLIIQNWIMRTIQPLNKCLHFFFPWLYNFTYIYIYFSVCSPFTPLMKRRMRQRPNKRWYLLWKKKPSNEDYLIRVKFPQLIIWIIIRRVYLCLYTSSHPVPLSLSTWVYHLRYIPTFRLFYTTERPFWRSQMWSDEKVKPNARQHKNTIKWVRENKS